MTVDLKHCAELCAMTYTGNKPVLLSGDHIAFRGTATARDWREDGKCELARCRPGRVHEGFLQALKDRSTEIYAAVGWPDRVPTYPMVLTGHSLGAALAVLTARWLYETGHLVEVVTFGCPKIGDAEFVRSIDFPVTRVVNRWDIVPRLPPLAEYSELGRLVWYNGDKTAYEGIVLPTGRFVPLELACNWEDHRMESYLGLFP